MQKIIRPLRSDLSVAVSDSTRGSNQEMYIGGTYVKKGLKDGMEEIVKTIMSVSR